MAPPPDIPSAALDLPASGGTMATPSARSARAACRVRRAVGIMIALAGLALLVDGLVGFGFGYWTRMHLDLRAAAWGGLIAAGATACGALPVLLWRGVEARLVVAMMSFSAGAMLAASVWSLLLPAVVTATASGLSSRDAKLLVACGVAAGAFSLTGIDRFCRWLSVAGPGSDPMAGALRGSWLFVMAIVLHNVPEGLSIGVGFAAAERTQAQSLALAIAIQDLPEGLVVALALRAVGYGRGAALTAGALSGVVEPIAAVAGAWLAGLSLGLLPWALAAAAGAMLFAIAHAIGPMLWQARRTPSCILGLAVGVVLMTLFELWSAPAP